MQRQGLFDLPRAADRKTRYTRLQRRVGDGDRLLIFTDGVLEAPNQSGELFGHKKLSDVLTSTQDRDPHGQVSAILDALCEHTNGALTGHDDLSLLMIEFVDNLASPALWTALRNRLFRRRNKENAFKTPRLAPS